MFWRRSGKFAALVALIAAALGGIAVPSSADAQYRSRPPRVYNPTRYSNTRALMNRRAAARAAELRRYCRAHPRAERCRKRAVRAR